MQTEYVIIAVSCPPSACGRMFAMSVAGTAKQTRKWDLTNEIKYIRYIHLCISNTNSTPLKKGQGLQSYTDLFSLYFLLIIRKQSLATILGYGREPFLSKEEDFVHKNGLQTQTSHVVFIISSWSARIAHVFRAGCFKFFQLQGWLDFFPWGNNRCCHVLTTHNPSC